MSSQKLHLQGLDHVAIRVRDMDISREWYQIVLGMNSFHPEEWGEYPDFHVSW